MRDDKDLGDMLAPEALPSAPVEDPRKKPKTGFEGALEYLQPKALRVINEILSGDKGSPELRAKVAQDVLDRLHGKPGPSGKPGDLKDRLRSMTDDQMVLYLRSLLVQAGMEDKLDLIRQAKKKVKPNADVVAEVDAILRSVENKPGPKGPQRKNRPEVN